MSLFGRWWQKIIPDYQPFPDPKPLPLWLEVRPNPEGLIDRKPFEGEAAACLQFHASHALHDLARLHNELTRGIEDLVEIRESMDHMLDTGCEARDGVDRAIRALIGYGRRVDDSE